MEMPPASTSPTGAVRGMSRSDPSSRSLIRVKKTPSQAVLKAGTPKKMLLRLGLKAQG